VFNEVAASFGALLRVWPSAFDHPRGHADRRGARRDVAEYHSVRADLDAAQELGPRADEDAFSKRRPDDVPLQIPTASALFGWG
jgi:hypothetical protein